MHVIELQVGVDLRSIGLSVIPPGAYLMDDINAVQIASFVLERKRGIARLWSFQQTRKIDHAQDYNGKKILVMRQGGFGDLLFATPAMREIKEKWPGCEIHVCCFARFSGALTNNPDVKTVEYPMTVQALAQYAAWVFLENTIEGDDRAKTVHAVDLTAEAFGITRLKSGEMIYHVTEMERAWADGSYPRGDRPRLGVQLRASAQTRDYPRYLLTHVVNQLEAKGWEIYIFGVPGDLRSPNRPNVRNLTLDNLTFTKAMAVLDTCDVVLGPDSALIHVAGALGKQAVALYGPFPSDLRTRYARTISPIFERKGCSKAPCFHHGGPKQPFPEGGPCIQAGHCTALAEIDPKTVIERIIYVYGRSQKAA